jgi:putative transferase (TIGR04331 family)
MKTLVLGTIPDDFSPDTHVPLGPWCFINKEEVYPEWESLSFQPDPFATAEELADAARITSEYSNSLIPAITQQLNRENGTKYSEKFWRLLVIPWLLYLVQTTWERQCRLKQFLQKHQGEAFRVDLVKDSIDWKFSDTVDFMYRGVLNPDYNAWLYSRMLERQLPSPWQVRYMEKSVRPSVRSNEMKPWRSWFKDSLMSRMRCIGVYGIGPANSIVWSLFLSAKPARGSLPPFQFGRTPTRCELNWILDFQKLLRSTVPLCFRDLENLGAKKKRIKEKTGKLSLIGPVIYYHEGQKLKLARRVEAGEKLVPTQHGGNYGELKSAPLISEVEYKHSGFFSWGWEKHEDYDGEVYPVASPYVSGLRDKHRQTNDELILVGTFANLFLLRFDSSPQALQQLEYRKSKCNFIESLKPAVFERTLYRPYPDERGAMRDRWYFEQKYPGVKILEEPLYTRIMRCKLLVLDHPLTTLNVALAANIPMVGFWDSKAWVMCRQAEPHFDAMQKAGVFFQTGKAAAEQVNKIWDDVRGWWARSEIQEARKVWCYQYARTSKLWWVEWLRVLWKM